MSSAVTVMSLKSGETITITGANSDMVTLRLNVGDALLNGDESQVWLDNDEAEVRLYLRRMPESGMCIGPALFSSLADLAQTVDAGDYYIG